MGKRRIGKRMRILPVCYLCGRPTGQKLTALEDKAVREALPADNSGRQVPVAVGTKPCAVCEAMIQDGGVFFLRMREGEVKHTASVCIKGTAARKLFADCQVPWKEGTKIVALLPEVYDQIFVPPETP